MEGRRGTTTANVFDDAFQAMWYSGFEREFMRF